MDLFNYLTSEKVISNVSNDAFITEAICSGLNVLKLLDPFQEINLLTNKNSNTEMNILSNNDDVDFFVIRKSYKEDDDEDAWTDVNREDKEDVNNIFDIIENIMEEN